MTTNEVLLGLALTVVLAVGSQVLARSLRIPALIVLLPVGFAAGALTDVIQPDLLLGPAFQPLVSLAVALILFDAGFNLDLRQLRGHTRRTMIRLVTIGVLITWGFAAYFAAPLLGMSQPAAVMLGAILIVSGPTVVGPLLDFVRPVERVQRILVWEGSLIDPIGGILGALVFNAVVAGTHQGLGSQVAQFVISIGAGVAGGVVGTAVLWWLARGLRLDGALGATSVLATVVGVAAVCDVLRDDTGLIAAIVMGLGAAKLRGSDVPARRPFAEALLQLVLGLLFISISATVTPAALRPVLLPALGLVAILVLVARPLAAAVCTLRTDLTRGERGFIGWMAPRGIVAAATASTFGTTLAVKGIDGAAKILPATFLVIVASVTLYGLTAAPVARWLGVTRPARTRPLLVGDDPWVVDLAVTLRSAGLDVLMWSMPRQRERVRQLGIELVPEGLLAEATARGLQIEGITALLLLTGEDDFNALAATLLAAGNIDGPVYRVAPPPGAHGVVHSYTGGGVLFGAELSRDVISRRYDEGAMIVGQLGGAALPPGHDLLFRIRADGRLVPVVDGKTPPAETGDRVVLLGPARPGAPAPTIARTEHA